MECADHDRGVTPFEMKPSPRRTGLSLSIALTAAALFPLLRHHTVRLWPLVIAAHLAILAIAAPRALAPIHRVATWLVALLQQTISFVIIVVIFFLVLTPVAALLRLMKKNLMRLGFEPRAATYWIPREPPGPLPETFVNLF